MTARNPQPLHPKNRNRLRTWRLILIGLIGVAAAIYGPIGFRAYQERQLTRMDTAQLEAVVKAQPSNTKARYQLGLAYARAGHYRESTGHFLAVLEKEPVRADVLNDLGVSYLLQQRYYEALVALQGALSARPNYAPAYANLGRLHLATKMPFTAVRELEQAAKQDPDNADTLCDLGEAYQRTLNLQSAVAAYQKALKARPGSVTAQLGLGRSYYGLAQYAQAEQALNDALKQSPEEPTALMTLGRMHMEQARSDADVQAAVAMFQRSAKADPENPDVWSDLGKAQLRMRQPEAAIESLRHALSLSAQHPAALHQLERALRSAGRTADADRVAKVVQEQALREREETRLEEVVSRSPEDWDSQAKLAELYLRSGQRGLTMLICRRLEDKNPQHPALPRLKSLISQSVTASASPASGSKEP